MARHTRGRALKLSIVLPVLNEAQQLARTLGALAPLRERGCEVIVVDGGSTDDTPEIARPLADRVVVASRGRANQQNAGAGVARHEALLFLHADTQLPVGADRLILAALGGRAVWGRFDVAFRDLPDEAAPLPRMLDVVAQMMNWRSRVSGIATGDQCIFVAKDVFHRVGGFPAQPLMEDVELSRRLKTVSPPVCLRACAKTSPRRWLKHGVWRTILLMWWLRLAYWFGASPSTLARWYGYS
ncbi:MAG: TIGR04283 family arsenosugar biosynthesis glycosyltransferase [Burkholderiales bacterium]|nr:TIGR04283 family arsenosugar biosynthesis glycosyltransferase [Burkholderiales bacterium]